MSATVLFCDIADDRDEARRIAQMFKFQLVEQRPLALPYLELSNIGLILHIQLQQTVSYRVDFLSGALPYRTQQAGKKQLIARACGIQKNKSVVDGMAGFGRDGFVLASLGMQVTLVEQHPVIAALLLDGVQRFQANEAWVSSLSVIPQAIQPYMLTTEARPDVVYLDPMFALARQALVKKDMQIIQALTDNAPSDPKILTAALSWARDRVVVKRHRQADYWGENKPNFELLGDKIRFDVYLR